jgi:hypothetical protein
MNVTQSLALGLLLLFSKSLKAQNYFQQEAAYNIDVRLDDQTHRLHGFETIRYTNNSKDTLRELWFHLWPNAYSSDHTDFASQELNNNETDFHFSKAEDRGGIDSLDFMVQGVKVKTETPHGKTDIIKLIPVQGVLPGQTVTISTPFRVKIPSSEFSRLGHAEQQYQLCQWYPKPAVYDHKGWHAMPYLNQGEFYSEFGSFEVKITLPENYVVAATGNMDPHAEEEVRILDNIKNTKELLQKAIPSDDPFPPSSANMKTLTFRQNRVHDFAWFADKRYHIMTGEVQLERSGRTIKTYAYFCNKNANEWAKAVAYTNEAVKLYSRWIGDYPYDVCKVVDGALSAGAGMEYPTITIIAYPGNPQMLDRVIAHEVGHNWFYGILASNERDYPWMDEGMNSYYEKRYMAERYPDAGVFDQLSIKALRNLVHLDELDREAFYNVGWLFLSRRNDDIPVSCHSADFRTTTYGAMVYEKTAGLMRYMAAWMGQEKFDAMMQGYYSTWQFRHPYPDDFKKLAEDYNAKPLSWWFDDLLSSRKRLDYALTSVNVKDQQVSLQIKNKGQIAGPFSITRFDDKGEKQGTTWHEGFYGTSKLLLNEAVSAKYSVNGTYAITDFNCRNDEIKSKGLFKRTGSFKLHFLTGFETPNRNKLYYLPAIGYNLYNGLMGGAVLHNIGALRKKFEFTAMPLYGFRSKSLAGNVNLDYFIRPVGGFLKSITLNASASRYGLARASHFDRFVTGVSLVLKNRRSNSLVKKEIIIRHIQIEYTPYHNYQTPDKTAPLVKRSLGYNQLLFSFSAKRKLNPYGALLDVQQGDGFVKASATIHHFFAYNAPKRGLQVRLFAGSFLWKANGFSNPNDVRFRLSGQNGDQDYLFNDLFIGRQETGGLWSRQMTETDGAFKVYSGRGQTLDHLMALNLKSGIPGNLPVKLFADLGYYFNEESDRDQLNYCAGAVLSIIPEAFEIYFPFLISKRIEQTMDLNPSTNRYGERIRFVLNLKLANPVNALRNFDM